MSDDREQKNIGLIYDLLVAGGAPTAITALVAAGGLVVGYGVYRLSRAVVEKVSEYLSGREQDLQDQLDKVRQAQAALSDAETDDDMPKSAGGAHGVYR